jgi:hypothetical protein
VGDWRERHRDSDVRGTEAGLAGVNRKLSNPSSLFLSKLKRKRDRD